MGGVCHPVGRSRWCRGRDAGGSADLGAFGWDRQPGGVLPGGGGGGMGGPALAGGGPFTGQVRGRTPDGGGRWRPWRAQRCPGEAVSAGTRAVRWDGGCGGAAVVAGPLAVRGVAGNLAWAADGSVWGCYRVSPFGYPHRAAANAREVHARTTAALLTLPRQSLVLSVARPISEGELAERIAAGGDRRLRSRLGRAGPPSRGQGVGRSGVGALLVPCHPTPRPRRCSPASGPAPSGRL